MPARRKPQKTTPDPKQHPARDYLKSDEFQELVKTVARNVRTYRLELGLTLDQASEKMDLELRHLQKIEVGSLNPSLVTLMRVANGLGKPIEALFSRS